MESQSVGVGELLSLWGSGLSLNVLELAEAGQGGVDQTVLFPLLFEADEEPIGPRQGVAQHSLQRLGLVDQGDGGGAI